MVCCFNVSVCFGIAPHHMPDHVVTLAWHSRPHKIRSRIRELIVKHGMYISGGVWEAILEYSWAWKLGLYHPCILLPGLTHAWSI